MPTLTVAKALVAMVHQMPTLYRHPTAVKADGYGAKCIIMFVLTFEGNEVF
jgi:hypothetical protein